MLHSEDSILLIGLLLTALGFGLKWIANQLQETNAMLEREIIAVRQIEARLEPRKFKPSKSHLSKSGIRLRTHRVVFAAAHSARRIWR